MVTTLNSLILRLNELKELFGGEIEVVVDSKLFDLPYIVEEVAVGVSSKDSDVKQLYIYARKSQ